MTICTNHPDHRAIENCELCGIGLCGLCLWYTDDGHRLCEAHARERQAGGQKVIPPDAYQEAIPGSMSAQNKGTFSPDEDGIYRGNQTDFGALIAAILGLFTLASCFGGLYCMPLLALILGIFAYRNLDLAVDSDRSKVLALIGVGTGGLFILAIVGFILFYVLLFVVLINTGSVP